MTCFYCKGQMQEATTTYTVDRVTDGHSGFCLIVVRNVPCLRCERCNAEEFTTPVVKRLEQIVQECRSMMTEIMVVNYNSAA